MLVPGEGGPLIPLLAFPKGFKFNCFAEDKSNNHCSRTPSLIKVYFLEPKPSASNNLEPRPRFKKGSSIIFIAGLAICLLSISFKKLVLRAIADPFIAEAKWPAIDLDTLGSNITGYLPVNGFVAPILASVFFAASIPM